MQLKQIFFGQASPKAQDAREAWWQSLWFWLLLALLSILPFVLSPLPPLGDLFSHMGRYHVMLNHDASPLLQRYYQFRWGIVPNLGQDLLMVPFGRIFGVERGALFLAALVPPAMILGFRALSKAIHGEVQPIALLALPFSYSFTFIFGFMNFHLGLAMTLWALVLWYRTPNWPATTKTLVFTLISLLVWICHIGAWAILLVAIGSFELVRAYRAHEGKVDAIAADLLPRLAPLLLPAILLLFGPKGEGGGWAAGNGPYLLKFYWLFFPLRDENKLLDLASLVLIGAVPALLLLWGKARIQTGLALFAALLFVLFWAMPNGFMKGSYGDLRLLPVIWIAVLIAFRAELSPRRAQMVAMLALALFGVRLAFTTYGWTVRGNELVADLKALDRVPEGARIAAYVPSRTCKRWWNDGLSHLASLAIVRRNAFVNSEWDIPTQNLMQPIYMRGTMYNSVSGIGIPGKCTGYSMEEQVAGLPRDRFDYVWILRLQLPRQGFEWLTPVYHGPNSTLFKVAHVPTMARLERR